MASSYHYDKKSIQHKVNIITISIKAYGKAIEKNDDIATQVNTFNDISSKQEKPMDRL
jgi:hypothetical protein